MAGSAPCGGRPAPRAWSSRTVSGGPLTGPWSRPGLRRSCVRSAVNSASSWSAQRARWARGLTQIPVPAPPPPDARAALPPRPGARRTRTGGVNTRAAALDSREREPNDFACLCQPPGPTRYAAGLTSSREQPATPARSPGGPRRRNPLQRKISSVTTGSSGSPQPRRCSCRRRCVRRSPPPRHRRTGAAPPTRGPRRWPPPRGRLVRRHGPDHMTGKARAPGWGHAAGRPGDPCLDVDAGRVVRASTSEPSGRRRPR